MIEQVREKVKRHIRTHSERSVEDRSAIALLGAFLNVKINAAGLKDREKAEKLINEAQLIADQAMVLETEILKTVNSIIDKN